jgi:hypothetical protein
MKENKLNYSWKLREKEYYKMQKNGKHFYAFPRQSIIMGRDASIEMLQYQTQYFIGLSDEARQTLFNRAYTWFQDHKRHKTVIAEYTIIK